MDDEDQPFHHHLSQQFDQTKIQNALNLLRSAGIIQNDDSILFSSSSTTENANTNDYDFDYYSSYDFDNNMRYLIEEEDADFYFQNEYHGKYYYWINGIGTLVTLGIVALLAGLFLGLLTLDELDLQIIHRASLDEDERMYAAALHPIVAQRHLLLVTLLILNALAYESLPLFLDKLVPSWLAILLSTTLILLFGEIIPSAIFTGPNQLYLAHQMAPLVKFLLWFMYPVAKPLSLILDYLVYPNGNPEASEESNLYNRAELAALVNILYEKQQAKMNAHANAHKNKTVSEQKLSGLPNPSMPYRHNARHHQKESWGGLKQEILEAVQERQLAAIEEQHQDDDNTGNGGIGGGIIPIPIPLPLPLPISVVGGDNHHSSERIPEEQANILEQELAPPMEKQEVDVVVGALQMRTKVVMDVYTPLRKVYAVPNDLILDRQGMTEIYAAGYSRVPVYHRLPRNENDKYGGGGDDDDDDDEDFNRWCIEGFLMTRQLMMIDWDHEREVSTLPLFRPEAVRPRMNLVQLLKKFQENGSHMAFVCARPDLANRALLHEQPIPIEAGFMGIVTFEDIMESILQTRIYDELDIRDRDRAVATLTRWATVIVQRFIRKKRRMMKKQSSLSLSPQKTKTIVTAITAADVLNERTPLIPTLPLTTTTTTSTTTASSNQTNIKPKLPYFSDADNQV